MIEQLKKPLHISYLFLMLFLFGNASHVIAEAWVQPPTQFTTTQDSQGISGAADGNSNAIAVYSDTTNGVRASYYTNGAWGPAQTLSNSESDFQAIATAMDATGTGLTIWQDQSTSFILSAHFSGGVWTTPTPNPLDTPGGPDTEVAIDMDGSGNGVGIWVDTSLSTIRSAFYNGGTNTWGPINVLGAGTGSVNIAYSSNGMANAIWENAGNVIGAYYNGTTWSAGLILGAVNGAALGTVTGIDSSGKAIDAWIDDTTGDVNVRTTTDGIIYDPILANPATQIAAGPGNRGVSLAVAPGGTAVLTWIDASFNGFASSYNGTTWGAPVQFASNLNDPFLNNQTQFVSVDDSGNALIVYNTFDPAPRALFSVKLPLGGVFSPPLLITDDINNDGLGSNALNLQSALQNNGSAFAFWFPDSEGPDVFASVLLADPFPPSDFVGTTCNNKFATQTDHVHILTWVPSTDPQVVAYNLRRNGVLIAIIPASGPFIYYDHNRSRRGIDVYTLTSVDALGVESTPLTVVLR